MKDHPYTAKELIALAKNHRVSGKAFEQAYLHYQFDDEYALLLEAVIEHRRILLTRLGIHPAAAESTLKLLKKLREQHHPPATP